MANRNPYIPSERVREMQERTEVHEKDANDRFAQQQADLRREAAREVQAAPADADVAEEDGSVGA